MQRKPTPLGVGGCHLLEQTARYAQNQNKNPTTVLLDCHNPNHNIIKLLYPIVISLKIGDIYESNKR